jgi:hypothetical protein
MDDRVMSRRSAEDTTGRAAWDVARSREYGFPPEPIDGRTRRLRSRRVFGVQRRPLRDLLLATTLLGITATSIAVAQGGAGDHAVTAARGEGDPITLGERNPGSGESTRETAIVANAGSGGLALRPSNTAKGGRAVSATCDNDGVTEEDGCAVYVNKGTGAAATFRTGGSVPFAIRETNNGIVRHLNADLLDGLHADAFLGRAERATDSARLEGNPASAFLGANAKAADADTLDGQDSSAFLGVNAKAADANTLDGQDSSAFLGSTSKAADAQLLDGVESDDYARVSGIVNGSNGNPQSTGITSVRNGEGDYSVTINDGTFSNSGASCSLLRPVISPVGSEFHAAVWNGAGCTIGGGGVFDVLTFDAAGNPEDATFGFIVDVVP